MREWQVPMPSQEFGYKGSSAVQRLSTFLAEIKEGLMIAPVVYVIVGSCGVALLRRSGDCPNVLRVAVRSEGSSIPRDNAGGSIPPPRTTLR
jgi:hypothetical protein